uniref:Uncharacterized protein n=1 Tax=Arundo donax TaxID=35708 RepID=A0A0A9FNS1_ARUDO
MHSFPDLNFLGVQCVPTSLWYSFCDSRFKTKRCSLLCLSLISRMFVFPHIFP